MSRPLALLFAAIALQLSVIVASPAYADSRSDTDRTGMCAAFQGAAFTFCVALCEARECDLQGLEDARCAALRRGFARVAIGLPPCDYYAIAVGPSRKGL